MAGRPRTAGNAGWRLSLVIPAYNEAAGIGQAIAEAHDALAGLADDYEILVVDDGSTDGTADAVVEIACGRPWLRLLRHPHNRGYGAALRTGFEAARFDRVAFTDADCQFHLADLASLVPLADHYPVVAGYRIDRQDPWLRRLVSWVYNALVRGLTIGSRSGNRPRGNSRSSGRQPGRPCAAPWRVGPRRRSARGSNSCSRAEPRRPAGLPTCKPYGPSKPWNIWPLPRPGKRYRRWCKGLPTLD